MDRDGAGAVRKDHDAPRSREYLSALPAETVKIIAVTRSLRPTHRESLAEYFGRLNAHLLGSIHVLEMDEAGEMS